ncbi:hypothetical protein O181_098644 [Austropuccinia psidii MF-1]|uniref:Uncharacterized protein n=1 Tax=Austropuccinia psidii MF-1 TaxID=1389203 RepID=A0A9Q3JB67_9BASI|nr:hypothetical protein [Austropuccinia psidii MF-1]
MAKNSQEWLKPAPLWSRPRATSTSEKIPRPHPHQRREFFSTPTTTSPLQNHIVRQESSLVKIKAKDYNPNFKGEEVEKCIRKVESIAQIERAREYDLEMQMEFWTIDSKISDAIGAMPGYKEGSWNQIEKDLITK